MHHDPSSAAEDIARFIRENAASEPFVTRETSHGFLDADPFPLRYKQALAYNVRRILLYAREQGLNRVLKEGFRRAARRD
jgi:hypothetical protein